MGRRGSGRTRSSGVGWWLGQQEMQCSGRVWPPAAASTLQYSGLEEALSDSGLAGAVCGAAESDRTEVTLNTSLLCACGSPAPVRVGCGGGAAALLAGTLAGQRVQGLKLPPLKE